ncbi:MAG: hypothetical protein AAF614_33490 [Chloroflexota bacterium]
MMTNRKQPDTCEATQYQIRLKGHLGSQWESWFDDFSIVRAENGETVLTGSVTDQAALYGLLKKARDLGLPLLALFCLEDDLTEMPQRGVST